jgi:hypothetical protein
MKPMGMKPVRFPGKTDCHPKRWGLRNWWEVEFDARERKKRERMDVRVMLRGEK